MKPSSSSSSSIVVGARFHLRDSRSGDTHDKEIKVSEARELLKQETREEIPPSVSGSDDFVVAELCTVGREKGGGRG